MLILVCCARNVCSLIMPVLLQGRVDDAIAELERLRKGAEADEQRAADLRRDADRLNALLRQTR